MKAKAKQTLFATQQKQKANGKNEKAFLPSSQGIEMRVIYNNEAVKFKACTYR